MVQSARENLPDAAVAGFYWRAGGVSLDGNAASTDDQRHRGADAPRSPISGDRSCGGCGFPQCKSRGARETNIAALVRRPWHAASAAAGLLIFDKLTTAKCCGSRALAAGGRKVHSLHNWHAASRVPKTATSRRTPKTGGPGPALIRWRNVCSANNQPVRS